MSARTTVRGMLLALFGASILFGQWRSLCDRLADEERAARRAEEMVGLGIAWRPMWPRWFWSCWPRPGGIGYRHAVVAGVSFRTRWANSDELERGGDEVVEQIARLANLERLDLSYAANNRGPFASVRVSDRGLAALSRLSRLIELDLSGQEISERGLPPVTRLRRLRRLNLSGCEISDAAVQRLRGVLPRATIVGP